MPKYHMYVTKTTVESAEFDVDADDKESAIEVAEKIGEGLSGHRWFPVEDKIEAEIA